MSLYKRFINWRERQRKLTKRRKCKHEEFVMDTQILIIECTSCGKRAWLLAKHQNLFP